MELQTGFVRIEAYGSFRVFWPYGNLPHSLLRPLGCNFCGITNFREPRLSEALAALIILGLVFPGLAWLCTRRATALSASVRRPELESLVLFGYLPVLAWVIAFGFERVARIPIEPVHSLVLLAVKLVFLVFVPGGLIATVGTYRLSEIMPISLRWRHLTPAVWMSLAAICMQMVLGRGLHDLREAHLPVWLLLAITPLCFFWLCIEVGVVEEFFFRVLLQEHLASVMRSSWGGLVLSALLFGLVHAPGFYLRPAATQELLGPHPSLFMAVGYSIVLTSLAGLFLGVLWMRTKNFAVIVIVHAAGDLLPNLLPWARSFHLIR